MLVLVRHGESAWNASDRFTGEVDISLTDRGRDEAVAVGHWLAQQGARVMRAYTSPLRRAVDTADLMLEAAGATGVPAVRCRALRERHYGSLQGMPRSGAAAVYGADRVDRWRRSIDARPPVDFSGQGESLADVRERVAPFVQDVLRPTIAAGHTAVVVSHGNTIRMLSQLLEGLSDEDACALELPTGHPRVVMPQAVRAG